MPGKKEEGVRYVIEKIDGMPDANLIIKYKNGKKISQKVVHTDNLKNVANESVSRHSDKKQPKIKIVYAQVPQNNQQPIVVERQAGFGTYLMQGFGLGLGLEAAGALFDGIDGDYGDY